MGETEDSGQISEHWSNLITKSENVQILKHWKDQILFDTSRNIAENLRKLNKSQNIEQIP